MAPRHTESSLTTRAVLTDTIISGKVRQAVSLNCEEYVEDGGYEPYE